MEREIIIGIIAFVSLAGGILYFRQNRKSEPHPYADILTNDEYKVKGQWEK